MYPTRELIEHSKVSAIVENVNEAKAEVKQAMDLLLKAKTRLKRTLGDGTCSANLWKGQIHDSDYSFEGVKKDSEKIITQSAWRFIIHHVGFNHFMTEKRQKELEKQIDNNELPELTEENIMGTLVGLSNRVDGLLQESLKEVYDWLRPREGSHRASYKTNKIYKVGERVITYGIQSGYHGGFRINHYSEANYRGLGNVFSLLDGKGVEKYPTDLVTRFNGAMDSREAGEKFEDDYFEFKCYRNGNVHVKFKSRELLQRFNQMAAEADLRGPETSSTFNERI